MINMNIMLHCLKYRLNPSDITILRARRFISMRTMGVIERLSLLPVLGVAILLWTGAICAMGENVVQNPSFSNGLDAWQAPQAGWASAENCLVPEFDANTSRTPTSGSVVFRGSETGHATFYQPISLQGERVKVSGWVKGESFSRRWVARILVHFRGEKDSYLGNCSIYIPARKVNTDEWVFFSQEADVPEGTKRLTLELSTVPQDKNDTSPNEGDVWFDDISVEFIDQGESASTRTYKDPKEEGTTAVFYPYGASKGIYLNGEPIRLAVKFKRDIDPDGLYAHVLVNDYYGGGVEAFESLPVEWEDGVPLITFPSPDKFGYFVAYVSLENEEGVSLEQGMTGFCVVHQRAAANDGFFGVSGFRNEPWMGNALKRLGVDFTLVLALWRDMEPEPGIYDFSGFDTWLEANESAGLGSVGLLCVQSPLERPWITPVWELERLKAMQGSVAPDQQFREGFAVFVTKLMSKYQYQVHKWDLMSEVNVYMRKTYEQSLADYVAMVKTVGEVAKKVNPDIILAGVGVAADDAQALPSYPVSRAIWEQSHHYLDEFWPHNYGRQRVVKRGSYPQIPEVFLRDSLEEAVDLIQPYGKHVLGNSENGYAIDNDIRLDDPLQRLLVELTARTMIIYRSVPEAESYCYFTVLPTNTKKSGFSYGLWMDESGGDLEAFRAMTPETPIWPMPVAMAYATVAKFLDTVETRTEVFIQDGVQCYGFQKPDQAVFTVWTTKDADVFLTSPCELDAYNLMGNKVARYSPGPVTLHPGGEPVFLVAEADAFEALKTAFEGAHTSLAPLEIAVSMASENQINVYVKNILDRPLAALCRVSVDAGPDREEKLDLSSGEMRALSFPVSDGKEAKVVITTVDGRKMESDLALEALHIPRSGSPLSIDLSGLTYLNPLDAVAAGLWEPGECAVKIDLSYDTQYLRIAAVIRNVDPIQLAEDGSDLWKQDSLLVAIDCGNNALPMSFGSDSGYDRDDMELIFGLTKNGPMATIRAQGQWNEAPAQLHYNITQNGSDVQYDLEIPWSLLAPLTPKVGATFKMNLLYAHANSPERQLPSYWFSLTPGVHGGSKDPFQFRSFTLGPANNVN